MNEIHELLKSMDQFSLLNLSKTADDPRYARILNLSYCLEAVLRDVVKLVENDPKVKSVLTNYSDFYKLKVSEHKAKFKTK
jgi:hypothetical protein